MHNLISHNQLEGWRQDIDSLTHTLDRTLEESNLINDYYNCLIECDENQASCKRVCRRILQ
jgi:hypothetical protein